MSRIPSVAVKNPNIVRTRVVREAALYGSVWPGDKWPRGEPARDA